MKGKSKKASRQGSAKKASPYVPPPRKDYDSILSDYSKKLNEILERVGYELLKKEDD